MLYICVESGSGVQHGLERSVDDDQSRMLNQMWVFKQLSEVFLSKLFCRPPPTL